MSLLNFLPVIGKVLDRVIPDKGAAAEAKQKLAELHQAGALAELEADTKLALGQQEINKVEAANPSLFVSGWRPAIGWVCAISLGTYFVPRFLIGMYFWARLALDSSTLPPMPEMGIGDILGLTATILGASWIRSKEKIAGVAAK